MGKTLTEDVGEMVKVGLEVYDRDGTKVGYVDSVSKGLGWADVRLDEMKPGRVWVPYSCVKSVDEREIFVTMGAAELRTGYADPPQRNTGIVHRDGKTVAVTTTTSGYDGAAVVVSEVDVDHIRQLVAVDQRVWTADDAELGKIKDFDATTGYVLIEKGILSRKHDLLIPLHVIADVNREAGEVTLALNQTDLKRMQHLEPVNVIIDLPAVPGH